MQCKFYSNNSPCWIYTIFFSVRSYQLLQKLPGSIQHAQRSMWRRRICWPFTLAYQHEDYTSSPPESTRNTYHALPALTLPVPSVPYTTRGQRHQRTATLEMRHKPPESRGKHWPPWRLTRFEISMLRSSPPVIVGERRTGRPAAATWPGRRILGHIDPRTWHLVF